MTNISRNGLKFGRKSMLAAGLCTVIALSCIFLLVPRSSANQPPPKSIAALTVTAIDVVQTRWPTTIDASGAIAPWQEAVIGAQVSGLQLAEVRVNVGDQVKRGQVLARYDAALLLADESRLDAAWRQADANRQRALQLQGSGGISAQDVLQYVTQAAMAKAQLHSTRLQMRYAQVTAPDDGVISSRSATVGTVSATGQELFRMIRQNRLEWRGEMTAAQLVRLAPDQSIDLILPDGSAAQATVRQTAPSFDSQTRLGIVYADIAAGSAARAGMYAQGKVVLAQSPALVVPATSVVIRDGRSYTPKLLAGDRVSLQPVSIGRRRGSDVEVVSGLHAGEKIVVQGAGFLNDGDLVRVTPAPSAAKE